MVDASTGPPGIEHPHQAVSVMPSSPIPYSAPPSPEPYTPPRCAVPDFPPIRAGGRRQFLHRPARGHWRRSLAFGLALTAAALATSTAHGAGPHHATAAPRGPASTSATRDPAHTSTVPATHGVADTLVRAPVRIADAAAAGLLRPGDRIDVLAGSRVVAASAAVVAVPDRSEAPSAGGESVVSEAGSGGGGGALVVLAVSRRTAAALSGAAVSSPLAVTLC
jgi:hypothetical protein